MFIIMTVNTKIFPIRTITGIIFMVSIFMVHREQVKVTLFKLSGAFSANPSVKLK